MKRIEPFLTVSPLVLDYEPPPEPKTAFQATRDACEQAIDSLGGPGVVLLVAIIGCLCFGMSIHGPVGAMMVAAGGVFLRFGITYWSRSTRW